MAEFYSARGWEIPPLPWTNLSPPFSEAANIHDALRASGCLGRLRLFRDVILIDWPSSVRKKQIEVDVGRRRCAVIGNDEFYQMVEAERLTPSGVTVEIVLILINTTERNA